MAEVNSLRVYLIEQMKFRSADKANAVMTEGLDTYAAFLDFTKDDIKTLCNSIRKPGGMINGEGGADAVVNNGMHVPAIAETRLAWATYAAKYYHMIGRPINSQTMAWNYIQYFNSLKEERENHTPPDSMQKLSPKISIMKWINLFEEHLSSVLGVRKVPLQYIIRDDVVPVPINDDPLPAGDGSPPYATRYDSFHDEMVARTSHNHPGYKADNKHVFNLLNDGLAGTGYVSSIQPFSRRKNGREAYKALVLHNLGSAKWDKVAEEADRRLTKVEWNGKSQRFTLLKHLTSHRNAHNDLVRSSRFIDYQVPSESQRVKRLFASIKCNDSRVESVRVQVLSDPTGLGNDFEKCADLLLLARPTNPSSGGHGNNPHRISALSSGGKGKRDSSKIASRGKTGVEFTYYSKREYEKLNKAQKHELWEWQLANKRSRGNPPPKNDDRQTIAAMQQQITELKELVNSQNSDESSGNGNHPALKRPPTQRPAKEGTLT
jgi:hypothetical protein